MVSSLLLSLGIFLIVTLPDCIAVESKEKFRMLLSRKCKMSASKVCLLIFLTIPLLCWNESSVTVSQRYFRTYLNYGYMHVKCQSKQIEWFLEKNSKQINYIKVLFYLRKNKTMIIVSSHLTFTCSKSIMEILEKVWTMFKVNNKNTRITSLTSFGSFYC